MWVISRFDCLPLQTMKRDVGREGSKCVQSHHHHHHHHHHLTSARRSNYNSLLRTQISKNGEILNVQHISRTSLAGTTPQERNFNEEVGMSVEMENNSSCLHYSELLFTDDVYQLILNETILFERQKRRLGRNLQGHLHDFSIL